MLNVNGPVPPGVAGRLMVESRRAIGSNESVAEAWMPTFAVEPWSSQRTHQVLAAGDREDVGEPDVHRHALPLTGRWASVRSSSVAACRPTRSTKTCSRDGSAISKRVTRSPRSMAAWRIVSGSRGGTTSISL